MSDTCSLLPPFGDPWPSCLLPSHWFSIFLMELSNKFWILLISTHLKLIKITLLFLKYIYFLYCICIASVSFPWFWWVVATVWLPCTRFSLRWLPLSCSTGSQARWLQKFCCWKGDPFQGLKLGSCLTLGNELSEETHVLRKQEILLERAPGRRAGGSGNPEELPCRVACSLGFYGDEISFQMVFGRSF